MAPIETLNEAARRLMREDGPRRRTVPACRAIVVLLREEALRSAGFVVAVRV